ncbi:MAG: HU family DNA-binding protein [Paludibacter sp.]|nr:HU family DNA-binding protein [Paludibacter sp.]
MAVTYVVVEKGNPLKPENQKKFYAQAKASGEVTLKKLSREIAKGLTTVSDTDVLAVLNDLTRMLSKYLSEGRIVRFGDFGAFQITLSSTGAETESKFHSSLISKRKVSFRPGVDMREKLDTLKFEKME